MTAQMADVRIREDGFVDAIRLEPTAASCGRSVRRLHAARKRWSAGDSTTDREIGADISLPTGSLFADAPAPDEPSALDQAKRFAHGWAGKLASVRDNSCGVVFLRPISMTPERHDAHERRLKHCASSRGA